MEWEAFFMRFPDQMRLEAIPNNWQPPSIGSSGEVRERLEAAFPDQEHSDGQTTVKKYGSWVKFTYAPSEATDEPVKAIYIRSNAQIGVMPILRFASDRLKCRMFDLQTGKFADFAEQTEASLRDFAQLCRRVKRERRGTFGLAVVLVVAILALQDSGVVPAIKSFSKPATFGYGFIGLIFLNMIVFLSTIIGAMRQLGQLPDKDKSAEERERRAEMILVPTFQGEGTPPSFVSRFLHIPSSALWGIMAGSILAWMFSLVFF